MGDANRDDRHMQSMIKAYVEYRRRQTPPVEAATTANEGGRIYYNHKSIIFHR